MIEPHAVEQVRAYLEAALSKLPPKPLPEGLPQALAELRALSPHVGAGPWFLSEVEEDEFGSEFITLGAHEPPHFEEMVAQFFLGNHGDETARAILILLNNLEGLVEAAERGLR